MPTPRSVEEIIDNIRIEREKDTDALLDYIRETLTSQEQVIRKEERAKVVEECIEVVEENRLSKSWKRTEQEPTDKELQYISDHNLIIDEAISKLKLIKEE